jgi:segregation and condensation protein B
MELSPNDVNEHDNDHNEQSQPTSQRTNAASENLPRPDFLALTRREQMNAVEVLLFASEEPLSALALYDILVFGEDSEKKNANKSTKNGTIQHEPMNGKTSNGTSNEALSDISTTEPNSEILKIAYLQAQPPEGFIDADSLEESFAFDDDNSAKTAKPDSLIIRLIDDLNEELEATGRVFRVIEVAREGAKGFQFATKTEHGELLARLVKAKSKKRLSKAGLETLAIIAYRQPVSKPELEVIRGVSSHEIMNRLLEKNLITIVGRSESVGKPLLYGTTDEFLRLFGLHSIADLPKPRELEELMAERADILETAQNLLPNSDTPEEYSISQPPTNN